MLLEALIGILIFSIGVLAMVGMQATAFSASADAKNRAEAAAHANRIISDIWMSADRSSTANLRTSLESFRLNTTGAPSTCNFTGGPTDATNARLTAWVSAVTDTATGLLGATANRQQITFEPEGGSPNAFNRVTVTVCWQTPQDVQPRRHQVITNVY